MLDLRLQASKQHREKRRYEDRNDQRGAFQRDRDRILYTSSFRRLANVTQVVGPSEGHVFHNRLTHTLEVAQIARRLAEKLRDGTPELATRLGGIDPDVVEAAALAHDLGHPPFGHIAEKELDLVAREKDPASDGFEGNAQSFRIITRVSAHRVGHDGLNLTRATLNAVLKYPWFRSAKSGEKAQEKFSAYRSEATDFAFARERFAGNQQSVEASIMDVADDIAYSVHDLDDFYRAGLIPIADLRSNDDEYQAFLTNWAGSGKVDAAEVEQHKAGLRDLLFYIFPRHPYSGTHDQRAFLRRSTSSLIGDFIRSVELLPEPNADGMLAEARYPKQIEMRFLQRLVWSYVITNPRLATQQHGQREIIRYLFETYHEAIVSGRTDLLPPRYQRDMAQVRKGDMPETEDDSAAIRLAVDIVAHFTDAQAVAMYRRLKGVSPGSVVELLHS